MSSADILACDNCTVNSFNFANFIKVKNKKPSLNYIPLLTYYTPSLFGFCIFILHNEWKNFTIVYL